jgi:glycosyltransferase involved in cell wall biosynthesis
MGGGAELVVVELCNCLQNEGHQPVVITLKSGWLTEKLSEIGVEFIILENKKSYDFRFFMELVRIIREKKIDLIHSHEFLMNTYGTAASMVTGCPIIMTIHGKGYYTAKWRRRAVYWLVSRCAFRTVAVSNNLKNFLIGKIKLSPSNVSVICNGVDVNRFITGDEKKSNRLKDEFGLKGIVIGAIGNLYPVKGHIHLIRAARLIVDEFDGANFVVIGKKTDYLNFLQEEVKRHRLTDHFLFLGFRDDIPQLMQLIDIFVLPSSEETFSMATIEALASSKPVVATRCGGPEEIIVDGKHGFLVPIGNPEKLAKKIMELIRNPDLRRAIGEEGHKLVREKFTTEVMFDNYKRLYEEAWGRAEK